MQAEEVTQNESIQNELLDDPEEDVSSETERIDAGGVFERVTKNNITHDFKQQFQPLMYISGVHKIEKCLGEYGRRM